jgi:hypothetical protein
MLNKTAKKRGREGEGAVLEPNHTTARKLENLVLFSPKSSCVSPVMLTDGRGLGGRGGGRAIIIRRRESLVLYK